MRLMRCPRRVLCQFLQVCSPYGLWIRWAVALARQDQRCRRGGPEAHRFAEMAGGPVPHRSV